MGRAFQIAFFTIGISCRHLFAESTKIDAVNFEETPLSEAVEFFRQKSNGLNFVIDSTADDTDTTTLKLANLPHSRVYPIKSPLPRPHPRTAARPSRNAAFSSA